MLGDFLPRGRETEEALLGFQENLVEQLIANSTKIFGPMEHTGQPNIDAMSIELHRAKLVELVKLSVDETFALIESSSDTDDTSSAMQSSERYSLSIPPQTLPGTEAIILDALASTQNQYLHLDSQIGDVTRTPQKGMWAPYGNVPGHEMIASALTPYYATPHPPAADTEALWDLSMLQGGGVAFTESLSQQADIWAINTTQISSVADARDRSHSGC
jgi:hypothetical protein